MTIGTYIYKGIFALSLFCMAAVLAVGIHYGWRAFVADTFIVPSDSMQPTLMPGDKVKVDKLIFGARIYKSLDFTDGRLECWRTRGQRGLRPNDIIVFNYPVNGGKIGFKINYVYVKRCVALPGDTISFVHSRPVNNNYHGTIGVPDMQQQLESVPDDQLPWGVMWPILTGDPRLGWSAKTWGRSTCRDATTSSGWTTGARRTSTAWPSSSRPANRSSGTGNGTFASPAGSHCPTTGSKGITTSYAGTMPPTHATRATGASCRKNTSWAWYRKWWNP